MKLILPFIAAILFCTIAIAQPDHDIAPGNMIAGTYSDPAAGYITTTVAGETWRQDVPLGSVRYNHLNQYFLVNGAWLTRFNIGPTPVLYGSESNNADFFQFQGTNEIKGLGGAIMFDTVYFDIGTGNIMHITNYDSGYLSVGDYYGQPPGGIAITRKLFFNNGITTTVRTNPVNSAIVFINSAGYDGGLTDAQHVDGFVNEINYFGSPQLPGHNGDFTFPVGNGSAVYQLRRQGVFEETDSSLTVGWVDGDPSVTTDPTHGIPNLTLELPTDITIAKVGFWDWHFQDITDVTFAPLALSNAQTITVSIPDFSGFPTLLASELRLIGYDPGNSEWLNLSGSTGASGLIKGSTLMGTIPAGQVISALAIGSTNAIILPVTFGDFTVKADGCKALLQWETGTEQNNSHFIVERSSNGNAFSAIARISAAGNSNSLLTYRYIDEAPLSGTNYYRVTQVDFDGKHSSTDIKAIKIQCGENAVALKAYPNPATNQVIIQTGKAVAQVNLLSSNGQIVLKYRPAQNQRGTFPLNIHSIQKGIYLLQVVNKDGTIDVIKLLKQ